MTPTLLNAVARKAGAFTPDRELLARYAREQDHAAFEELVRRHGPLVWAVCRHLLPHHADAEDAFQAVFLTLIRSASTIRDSNTLPAWLHGVAVRVAIRARREFTRRRTRERLASVQEADWAVSDAAWEALAGAVHEEVQKLPEAERTAFVLCELQGVSQADAAAKLGWPLGSVSGRLCKARQRLMDRLAACGVAPAAAVGIGITSGSVCAVPVNVFEVVKSLSCAPAAASTAATALARGFLEGMAMRLKLTVAAVVMAAAFGMTGGAMVLSKADEPIAPSNLFPPAPPAVVDNEEQLADEVKVAGGGPKDGEAFFAFSPGALEYKFVDIKNDRKAFESAINKHGQEGWEFCGSERFSQGEVVLVFKKHKFSKQFGFELPDVPKVPAVPAIPGSKPVTVKPGGDIAVINLTLNKAKPEDVAKTIMNAFPKQVKVTVDPKTNMLQVTAPPESMKQIQMLIKELDGQPGDKPKPGDKPVGIPKPTPFDKPATGDKPASGELTVITLKNAGADELQPILAKLFKGADITSEPRSNSLIIRTDKKTAEEIQALVNKLDTASKP